MTIENTYYATLPTIISNLNTFLSLITTLKASLKCKLIGLYNFLIMLLVINKNNIKLVAT